MLARINNLSYNNGILLYLFELLKVLCINEDASMLFWLKHMRVEQIF